MNKRVRHVGLDVHAQTTSVAFSEEGLTEFVCTISSTDSAVLKALKKLGTPQDLVVVYEAGPSGYALCRTLLQRGYTCNVIAPSLIPSMPGDRVKTDRRDAKKLAQLSRAGLLTNVAMPSEDIESLRDLVRCREGAKQDEVRSRHRVSKFCLRYGVRKPKEFKSNWTQQHLEWLAKQQFAHAAQQSAFEDLLHEIEHQVGRVKSLEQKISMAADKLEGAYRSVYLGLQGMRGIAKITAATIVTEVGDMARFSSPKLLMSYAGVVPREHSSGGTTNRGAITKTGNAHLRRVIVESAWSYRFPPRLSIPLKKRQVGLSTKITEISWQAQKRLNQRYKTLLTAGKNQNKVMVALAREMLGFIWAIAMQAQKEFERSELQKSA